MMVGLDAERTMQALRFSKANREVASVSCARSAITACQMFRICKDHRIIHSYTDYVNRVAVWKQY